MGWKSRGHVGDRERVPVGGWAKMPRDYLLIELNTKIYCASLT